MRDAKRIILRIPLKAMGDPDRILISAGTYLGELPLDWAAWQAIFDLPPQEAWIMTRE